MKATKANINRAVDRPAAPIRFYLFHGQDESQSRAWGTRLLEALGASKVILSSGALKADRASLVDEACAKSLFGERHAIWIEPATNEITESVALLLNAPSLENPVVGIAGALPKSSALLKLAESSELCVAYASYLPEGRDAEQMVTDLGRRVGLEIEPLVAMRVADSAGNDRAVVARELEKFALYAGASPQAPRPLDQETIEAIGADNHGDNGQKLADWALEGEVRELLEGLTRLPSGSSEGIPVVRSLQRRVLMLAPMRARVERGEPVNAVLASMGKSLFFKDKPRIARMLARWSAAELVTIAERAARLERAFFFTEVPQGDALGEELLAIARRARRR